MSIRNYLYAGELREKTPFMNWKTHSTDQGKMRNHPEHGNQAEIYQKRPKYQSKLA